MYIPIGDPAEEEKKCDYILNISVITDDPLFPMPPIKKMFYKIINIIKNFKGNK